MSMNFAGAFFDQCTIDSPSVIENILGCKLIENGSCSFDEAINNDEENQVFIYSKKSGTVIFHSYDECEVEWNIGKMSIIRFALGSTADSYDFKLYEQGKLKRSLSVESEGILEQFGDKLEIENNKDIPEIAFELGWKVSGLAMGEIAENAKFTKYTVLRVGANNANYLQSNESNQDQFELHDDADEEICEFEKKRRLFTIKIYLVSQALFIGTYKLIQHAKSNEEAVKLLVIAILGTAIWFAYERGRSVILWGAITVVSLLFFKPIIFLIAFLKYTQKRRIVLKFIEE